MKDITILRTPGLPFPLGTWEIYYKGEFVGLGEDERCCPSYALAVKKAKAFLQDLELGQVPDRYLNL